MKLMKAALLSALLVCILPAFGDGYELIRDGISAVNGGDGERGMSLFEKAAGSRDTKTAACGHFDYGTALAMAASAEQDPEKKRELLKKAESALRRSYALSPGQDAQKNLYLVRQELMQLPPEDEKDQQDQDKQQNQDQNGQQDQQQGQEGQQNQQDSQGDQSKNQKDGQQANREQNAQNSSAQENRENSQQQQGTQDRQNPGDQQQGKNQAAAGGEDQDQDKNAETQAAKQSGQEQTEEEKELKKILDKEAREQATRILESAGGIQNVQKDW